jgi:hypothetical protein
MRKAFEGVPLWPDYYPRKSQSPFLMTYLESFWTVTRCSQITEFEIYNAEESPYVRQLKWRMCYHEKHKRYKVSIQSSVMWQRSFQVTLGEDPIAEWTRYLRTGVKSDYSKEIEEGIAQLL